MLNTTQIKLNEEQIEWLNKCTVGSWSLNPETGLVDVDGGFDCQNQELKNFKGVRFGEVNGYFHCYNNSLTTLEGAPQKVGGGFFCQDNSLTTLEGAPQEVRGGFFCGDNPIPPNILIDIWSIMKDKEVPYIIALGIYKKEVKGAIDPRLTEGISEKTIKGASLLARNLS